MFISGLGKDKKEQLKKMLNSSEIYLKHQYRKNLSFQNTCSDHCVNFGLSDKSLLNFNNKCGHQHSRSCNDCNDCNDCDLLKMEFGKEINNLYISKDDKCEAIESLRQNFFQIREWKHHIMRSFCQDYGMNKILSE